MKKIFLLLFISVCCLAASAATKYEINVAGVEVTSDNASRITGGDITGGYAVYNASSNTLTCYNLKIYRTGQDNYGIHNRKCDNLKIVFSGTCSVTCADNALKLERGTTLEALSGSNTTLYSSARIVVNLKSYTYKIQGSGELYVESNQSGYEAIKGDGPSSTFVYFKGAKVIVESANRSALSSFKANFFSGADLTIYSNGSNTSVSNVLMTFDGRVTVLSPYGAYYSNNAIYTSSGSQVTSQTIYISDDYVAKITSGYFPDATFRNYLLGLYPKGYINQSDVNSRTSIDVSSLGISNLTGVNYFSKLTKLSCYINNLSSLPTLPTSLQELYCANNKLTSLDLSSLTALRTLNCQDNQITSLGKLPGSLKSIDCSNNKLSGTVKIQYLGLVTLIIKDNPGITTLNCDYTALTSLYVSGCTSLTELNCSHSKLSELSNLPSSLKILNCSHSLLSALSNLPSSLQSLNCSNNKINGSFSITGHSALSSLDISNNVGLTTLNCHNNALTILNVEGCTSLTTLNCSLNKLVHFDFNKLSSSLKSLNCSNNSITNTTGVIWLIDRSALSSLDISNNPGLNSLYCYNNALTSLNVTGCSALENLDCKNNALTSLNLSGCTSLIGLNCSENRISSLSNLPSTLQHLSCENNRLSGTFTITGCNALWYLNIRNNPNLQGLNCSNNARLIGLYVDGCTALTSIDCSGCGFTTLSFFGVSALKTLNASNNSKLSELSYSYNALTSLNVTGCSALQTLYCPGNQLSSISLSGCDALRELMIQKNQIKGSAMTTLINSLRTIPTSEDEGLLGVFEPNNTLAEGNQITDAQIIAARAKRWMPKQYINSSWEDIPGSLTGDVNGDGKVNVSDVSALINMIMSITPMNQTLADVNGDGKVNVSDVSALINIILGV